MTHDGDMLRSRLSRRWLTIGVPGIHDVEGTYGAVDLATMPPVAPVLDGTLAWLLGWPACEPSLERGPDDEPEREADRAGLLAVAGDLLLPSAFARFIGDPEPRRHLRSATACYLDLGHFPVRLGDGGRLIHVVSDQQWVLHWLLYLGPDGSEAVVVTGDPLGFEDGGSEPVRVLDVDRAAGIMALCAETFEEFLYRFWAENELFFRLTEDRVELQALPDELRTYAEAFPASAAPRRRPGWRGLWRR